MSVDTKETEAVVQQIAEALNETAEKPLEGIRRIVNELGAETVFSYVEKAREVEKAGGLMMKNGKKRRSLGGVFFYLVRGDMSREVWKKVHVPSETKNKNRSKKTKRVVTYHWDRRIEDFREFKPTQKGVASVEIKLVGTPSKVLDKGAVMMLVMIGKPPTGMPKGLPALPESYKPTYLAMIAKKQWNKVAEQVKAGDRLVLTGFPVYDEKLKLITVLVKSTQTIPPKKAKTVE